MEEEQLTKRQRRLLKKEAREKEAHARVKKKKFNRIISWLVFFVLAAGLVWLFATGSENEGAGTNPIGSENFSEGDPVIGAETAGITIEEYSDFQCPACRAAEPILKSILEQYANDVKLVYNDFPLTQIHPNATEAAEAAQCAFDQNRFWEFHDILFERQDIWSRERNPGNTFFTYAEELELDTIVFSSCTDERRYRRSVQDDVTEGNVRGVNSTPTFFVNGKRVSTNELFDTVGELLQSGVGNISVEPSFETETDGNVFIEPTESAEDN